MKTIFKVLMALTVSAAFCSCGVDEPEYTPATLPDNAQVYFLSTLPSSLELSSTAGSFDVSVARVETAAELTVPLTATGTDGLYTVPSSVSFAQGAAAANITITYDPEEVGFDNFSQITLTLGDETTEYGLSSYTVQVGIPAPWKSLGTGLYVDDCMTTLYGVDNVPEEVEIQENQLQPGFFRVVNPYGAAYPYNEDGDWDDSRDWYLEIHAENPDEVYMSVQQTGMDWGSGMVSVGSMAGYRLEYSGWTVERVREEGLFGTYKDGIITFPVKTMLINEANDDGLYYANNNGAFKVVMPGIVLADYSVEVAYAGQYTDTKGNVTGILAGIGEVGGDVESIRIGVVEGEDADAAAELVRSGNVEAVDVAAESGTYLVPFDGEPADGKYTIVALAYADKEVKEYASATFKYTAPTSETWTAVGTGDYLYTQFFTDEDEEPVTDADLTLYQSDSDPTRFKIEHWGYDVDFIFTYNEETGKVLVEEQEVGYVHPSYGSVYVNDLVSYTGGTAKGESYFKDGVFHFAVVYYVSQGVFGSGEETFTVKGESATALSVHSLTGKTVSSHAIQTRAMTHKHSALRFDR